MSARLTASLMTPTRSPVLTLGFSGVSMLRHTLAFPTTAQTASAETQMTNVMPSGWRPSPVYTFLATLVLLLSVSAAIVTRSFILRRRHRRMVEEAIRNGTWVSPVELASGGRGPRVDLSKKPIMWEAYLGAGGLSAWDKSGSPDPFPADGGGGGGGTLNRDGDVKDWDSLKPLSVVYLATNTPALNAGLNNKPGPLNLPLAITDRNRDSEMGPGVENTSPSFAQRVGNGFRHIFPARSSPASPLENPASTQQGNTAVGPVSETGRLDGDLEPPSHTLQVTVLIAMPRPPKYASSNSTPSAAGPSSSRGMSPTPSHPLTALPERPVGGGDEDEEEPLPVLEVGVAEVMVVRPDAETTGQARRVEGKDVYGRDSVSEV